MGSSASSSDDRKPESAELLKAGKAYGEPVSSASFSGPVQKRKCRDVFFLLLYIAFWVGMVALGWRALHVGDYRRLTNGIDSSTDKICGLPAPAGAGVKNSLQYWPDPRVAAYTICVGRCPSQVGTAVCSGWPQAKCKAGSNTTFLSYPTNATRGYCLPAAGSAAIQKLLDSNVFGRLVGDLGSAWGVILGSAFIAVAIGFVWLAAIKYAAGPLVWGTVFLILALLGAGGYLLDSRAKQEDTQAAKSTTNRDLLQYGAYALWAACGVVALLVCCLRRRIQLAIGIMKEATVALGDMKKLLLLPLAKFALLALLFVYWIVIAVYIASAGEISSSTVSVDGIPLPSKSIKFDRTLWYAFIYHAFGLLWGIAFLVALAQLIISGAVSMWYFSDTVDGRRRVHSPLSRSICNALRYHLGSIAFGSLVLAAVRALRVVVAVVHKKAEAEAPNRVTRAVLCICACCLRCFERFMQFLNANAYIAISIWGDSFLGAAKRVFGLIARNVLRIGTLHIVGDIFLFLGKLAITAATTVIAWLLLTNDQLFPGTLSSPAVPAIVIAILAYAVASVFVAVYGVTINTLLICFITDEEMHGGEPRFVDPSLVRYVDQHGKDTSTKE
eukprot:PLAT9918.1.p2 GENE.PLAT9918.1~~PLAT9918.1.p2  ORF type:complete len:637 (+),score=345.23 PLAT9918.1:74-1912(+)